MNAYAMAALLLAVCWFLYGALLTSTLRCIHYNLRLRQKPQHRDQPLLRNVFPRVGWWTRPAYGMALLRPIRWSGGVSYKGWRGGFNVSLHVGPGAGYRGGRTFSFFYRAKCHVQFAPLPWTELSFGGSRWNPMFALTRGCGSNGRIFPAWW